ncbi:MULTISPECIES: DUF481 domain-containing protein [Pseudomonas]|jgi:hypothetical protein|uniref:Peptide chain release factor RF-3 n=1 Tax=Pseudomonas marincola TaxID=437900 RepID=A0A653E6S5_9PSED|nr:DUF481 domain-containing protein [Pseudomonas marincola]MAB97036.1 peptide chain release factor RF-3 [Pseudomonadaceae bacterium]MBQ56340.1 peptide chain release factor RF-3 [Pseudomonadaceae bacterium]CAE6899482.1 Peptide chain release factor RF-3 [Pseudomonas marincola]HCP55061.1 DUF481 domain-containing protein [Pseudomonas sp.]
MLSRTLLLLSASFAAIPAFADTVWLTNGDRVSGQIRFFDGAKLLIQTEFGGSIPIAWNKVATLESDQELLIKEDAVVGERAKSLRRGPSGKVILVNGEAPRAIELASIQQIMKPKPVIEDFTWRGNIDAGLDYERSESDTDDYDIDLKTKARHGNWRHNATAGYHRELTNDLVTTDNWDGEYALDRFIDEHWFWQGRLEYKRDKVEELERQRNYGTGPGYQFWDDELGAFSVAGLLSRTAYDYTNGEHDNFYALSAKWDYNRYLLGKAIEFFTNGEIGKPLGNVGDFSLDAEIGLRYKVTDWASLNLKAERELVNGNEGEIDDSRYTLGFGVGW